MKIRDQKMGKFVSSLLSVGRMCFLVVTDFPLLLAVSALWLATHNAWPLDFQSQQWRFFLVLSPSYTLNLSDFHQGNKRHTGQSTQLVYPSLERKEVNTSQKERAEV